MDKSVYGGLALSLTAVGAASYYMMFKPTPIKLALDLNDQSTEIEAGVKVSKFIEGEAFTEYLYDDAKTLYECFQRGLRVSGNGECLGSRSGPNNEYEWMTYKEVYETACNFGSGLINLGLKPSPDTFIGIYSGNRIEWTLCEQACNTYSLVTVPLYDTLGLAACQYIINQANISTIICDKVEKALKLIGLKIPSIQNIIILDKITDELKSKATEANIKLYHFTDIKESGKSSPVKPVLPKASDLATICYTSGTTGDPKGVMLTHGNLVSNIGAILKQAQLYYTFTSDDTHLSYLPLAHMFERGMQLLMFTVGAKIGFFRGDIKLLTEDLQALRPTLFPTVPRLLNRMYSKVISGVKGSKIKSTLLDWGISSKLAEIKKSVVRRNSIWDKLIFSKIQNLLGGRIQLIITGSAPLSVEVLNFTRCAFGCVVLEGYGQTEATAGITFNIPGETEAGHCGPPLTCNKVKLIDVPEMDYWAEQGYGEILAKGPNIFIGYFKNPEKTAETLDKDGWLHTGDIGMWLPNGVLKIIDRRKNIFKLAQGEYVAAEKIENIYQRCPYIAQVFLDGDSLKHCVMAVVVLDEEYMMKLANNNNNNNQHNTMEEMSKSESIKDMVLKDIIRCGSEAQLKGFEQIKDVYIHPELFSIENGLLTPTFKNKRPALRKYFKSQMDQLYANLKE